MRSTLWTLLLCLFAAGAVAQDSKGSVWEDRKSAWELLAPGQKEDVFRFAEDYKAYLQAARSALFSTREVIEHGAVAENKCDPKGKLRSKFAAKAGEIIVFVRFLRWLERMQT